MIIYGWGYFNRRNYTLTRGQCPSCGSYGYRQSYESTRFATLYFIPVIPLGTQKITGQCPSCKDSLGMSRGKWRKLKRKELPNAIAAYQADTTNVETAHDLISCLVACQAKNELRKHGPEIEAQHTNNEEVISHLALAYSALCIDDEADRLYLQCLDNNPSSELVEQSDLHMQAKDLTKPKPANRWLQSIPVLIVPLVILYFVGSYIGDGLSPTIDDAALVNGLSINYSVRLNGEEYTLRGNSHKRVSNVKYGENVLEPIGPDAPFEALTFTIDVSIRERMTSDQAAIINPDQTAIVLWQRDEYSTGDYGDYDYDLTSGLAYHLYDDIDYFFIKYPEEIQLPSSTSSVFKTRLSTLNDYSDVDRIESLFNHSKMEAGITFLTNKIKHESDASELLNYASYVLPAETLIDLIDDKLDAQPVLIEYHRQYQQRLITAGDSEGLVDEYRQRLAQNPNNHALTYLLARVVEDPNESLQLFKKAYSGSGADGYAAFALAYHTLLMGNPEKSEALIEQAVERAPENQNFLSVRETIWVANNNHQALARLAENELNEDPYDVGAFYKKLTAYQMKSPSASSQKLIDDFVNKLQKDRVYESKEAESLRFQLMAHVDQLTNNVSGYKTHIVQTDAIGTDYLRAVLDGRIAEALEILDMDELDLSGTSHLMLYSLASDKGEEGLAKTCLESAIQNFSNGSDDNRKWATWLESDQAPKISEMLHACQDLQHHYVILAAFAQRFPESANSYMQHARKICYEKDFTYLAMQPLLQK